jgi:hypothetical protein
MNAKAGYVRQRRDSPAGTHHCHWPGCGKAVPPAMWGCTKHWYTLPQDLRDRIWRTFQPGQEISKTPAAEYVEAARAVQAWIQQHLAAQPKQERLL